MVNEPISWLEFIELCEQNASGIFQLKTGSTVYLKDGQSHREDGPAYFGVGFKHYYLNDKVVEASSDEEFLKIVKLKAFL